MRAMQRAVLVLVLSLLAACVGALRLDASLFAPFLRNGNNNNQNEQRARDMLILKGKANLLHGPKEPTVSFRPLLTPSIAHRGR